MKFRDLRTPKVEHRTGFDPEAFIARLVERVPEPDGSYPYVDTATYLLAVAAGWAYADEAGFSDAVARIGLSRATYRQVVVQNDAMFVGAAAYLVRSECGRLAVLCFRGTMPTKVIDWFTDASVSPTTFRELGTVHGGFYRNVAMLWPKLWEKLSQYLADGKLEALYITGHSLGAAMAALAAMNLRYDSEYHAARAVLRGVYTFGQPMVADPSLAERCERDLGSIVFRHVYDHDLVPRLPPATTGRFAHFGAEYGPTADHSRWQIRDGVLDQTASALVSIPIGAAAWVMRQLALTRWIDLPFSWDDHSPIHYIRVSEPPRGIDLGRVQRVVQLRDGGPGGAGGAGGDEEDTAVA